MIICFLKKMLIVYSKIFRGKQNLHNNNNYYYYGDDTVVTYLNLYLINLTSYLIYSLLF